MNCPYCGTYIQDGARFCPKCGQTVPQVVNIDFGSNQGAPYGGANQGMPYGGANQGMPYGGANQGMPYGGANQGAPSVRDPKQVLESVLSWSLFAAEILLIFMLIFSPWFNFGYLIPMMSSVKSKMLLTSSYEILIQSIELIRENSIISNNGWLYILFIAFAIILIALCIVCLVYLFRLVVSELRQKLNRVPMPMQNGMNDGLAMRSYMLVIVTAGISIAVFVIIPIFSSISNGGSLLGAIGPGCWACLIISIICLSLRHTMATGGQPSNYASGPYQYR